MIVLKFGGTSVQNSKWIDNAIDIAFNQIDRSPVIVSSAMGKTTNKILEIIDYAQIGDLDNALSVIDILKNDHISAIDEFLTDNTYDIAKERVLEIFKEFSSLVNGISMLKECSLRSRDTLLSFGERLSTSLIYFRCMEREISSELLDSREFIKTDNNFNSATVNFELTNEKVKENIFPEKNKIIICQGFIGSNDDGVTTTLGRGGSDYSATIIGSALNAEEVQIWTDVTGIMTSDPRVIDGAKTISNMTYTEAAELAYFGAKVVHPATIQPAVKKEIPVWVKNTRKPEAFGTKITSKVESKGLKAISGKSDITLVNINSSKMLNAYGFLTRLFSVFEKHETSVDLISTSEVSVSVTIEDDSRLDEIISDLSQLGVVKTEKFKSIICMVGHELWKDSQFIARVFAILKNTNIRMISLGSSDTNLSFVVPSETHNNTIQLLHNEFFK